MLSSTTEKPLVSFGVLTDVQYADCEDLPAKYDPEKTRFYRHALNQIDNAFEYWKLHSCPVSFVLQLGDVIDGINVPLGKSLFALQQTLSKFESHSKIPTYHTVGNHELYNFKRDELVKNFQSSLHRTKVLPEMSTSVNVASPPAMYYKFTPENSQFKFISLDCFEISTIGYDSTHLNYKKAADILSFYHGHNDIKLWDTDNGLKGFDVRFQQMNGAVSKEQLEWLEAELVDSDRKGERVVVFGHVCLSPESADWNSLLWNYEEVISCFHRHHCVAAYFSGHSHKQGYAFDSHGIHYIVFAGIIETPKESSAFATVSLYSDKMLILGHGREKSHVLPLMQIPLTTIDFSDKMDIENVLTPASISLKV